MTAPLRPFCLYFAKFCVVTKMAVLTQAWLLALFAIGGKLGAGLLAASEDAGLYWPYSLMIMGMNSNRTEDVMAGGIWGFLLSCAVF